MSRLYDRILAEGCSPVTAADLIPRFWGDPSEWDLGIIRYFTEQVGREPYADELSQWKQTLRQASSQQVSKDSLSPDELEDAVVVSAEEVADYWNELPEGADTLDVLDVLAPPEGARQGHISRAPAARQRA
jgi:hypothetical protein